ncbi:hypothetical protein [Rhizobium ruizarguesonis]|nr:hypothetical protein [Rhizobium ruizarguesonis]
MTDGCFVAELLPGKRKALYDLMPERPGLRRLVLQWWTTQLIEMTKF